MQIFFILGLIFFSFSSHAQAGTFDYKLLKESRSEIVFPNITLSERRKIIEGARLVYNNFFVHRQNKIDSFGPLASPLAELLKVESEIDSLSDFDFSLRVVRSYNALKDWHTYITMPVPYTCFRTVLPISFKRVTDHTGKSVIGVEDYAAKEFLALLPEPLMIKKGDVLVSYNGIDPEVAINELKQVITAANDEALDRSAVTNLYWQSQNEFSIPLNNEINLKFKNQQGELYEVSVPWLTRRKNSCLNTTSSDEEGRIAFEEIHEFYNDSLREDIQADDYIKTDEPSLKYKMFQYRNQQFGIIKLESFDPEVLAVEQVNKKIRQLFTNEFKNTAGVIFDVRDNFGGRIRLAEMLLKHFSPNDVELLFFNLLANDFLSKYLNLVYDEDAFDVDKSLAAGLPMAKLQILKKESITDEGQVYFKPIAVLTNASCYSSCDMFAAQVQDNTDATIFGEDSTTGAGGANNWNLNDAYTYMPKDELLFDKMPLGMNIGFSYRQTIRGGKNQGALIENLGVKSDIIVRPSLDDLASQSRSQYEKISEHLLLQAKEKKSWVNISNEFVEVNVGERIYFEMEWDETTSIEIKLNGISLERRMVDYKQELSKVLIPGLADSLSKRNYEVIGYNGAKRVWKKIVKVEVLPRIIHLGEGESILFKLDESQDLIKLTENITNHGFVFENGLLKTAGEFYKYLIEANAYFYAYLPSDYILKFNLDIITDAIDYLSVVVSSEDNKVVLLKVSGQEVNDYSLDLSQFKGKTVKVNFHFKDEPSTTMYGIKIKDLMLIPKK